MNEWKLCIFRAGSAVVFATAVIIGLLLVACTSTAPKSTETVISAERSRPIISTADAAFVETKIFTVAATQVPPPIRNTPTVVEEDFSKVYVQPCGHPPDNYARVKVNGHIINARTLWMLQLASSLYHGDGDILNVTQGSYVDDLTESFGTHAGGGAVDISVRVNGKAGVLSNDELADMVMALRHAGFAAWLRLPGDLKPPTPLHIHAIAIGDRELSDAAYLQIVGSGGYLHGFDGVPPEFGGPKPDRYGGPVICDWMKELELGESH